MYMEEVGYTDSHCRQSEKKKKEIEIFFCLFSSFIFFIFFHAEKKVGGNNMPNTHIQHLLADTCACTPIVLLHVHMHSNYIYMCTCTLPYAHVCAQSVTQTFQQERSKCSSDSL